MLIQAVGEAARTCRGNLLRSMLGALAVGFAVAAVGVAAATLEGLSVYTRATAARAFGSETFVIAKVGAAGQTSRRELQEKLERNPAIRSTDVRFLERYAQNRVRYAPSAQKQADVVAGSRKIEQASITGTTFNLAQLREIEVESGRFLQPSDDRGALVAFIGADAASTLFPTSNPVGSDIRIAGRGFQVIGVQSRIGGSGGATLDRYVWIPLTAFERVFGAPDSLQVFARHSDQTGSPAAEEHARVTLRARRRLGPGTSDNFDILLPEGARSFATAIGSRVGAAAYPISAMALLAAIVVVTNTTLSSVSQRIREIGVRRAVGATRLQIILEILSESTLVALIGGLAGLGAGGTVVQVVSKLTGIPARLTVSTMAAALATAALSGIVAGLYPARRAVRVTVTAAMRTE